MEEPVVSNMFPEPRITILKKLCIAVSFSIAFAYIEASVVVYLRQIFYPEGFIFPLKNFPSTALWQRFFLIEVGREFATIAVIFTSCLVFGQVIKERAAYFMLIFAVWDIFFYVWLKIFLNWPASLMDWDILFLIPMVWAGPVLAPLVISLALILFAALLLFSSGRPNKPGLLYWLGLVIAALLVVISFCIAGLHITETNFSTYFYWPLFILGCILAVAVFLRSAVHISKR